MEIHTHPANAEMFDRLMNKGILVSHFENIRKLGYELPVYVSAKVWDKVQGMVSPWNNTQDRLSDVCSLARIIYRQNAQAENYQPLIFYVNLYADTEPSALFIMRSDECFLIYKKDDLVHD